MEGMQHRGLADGRWAELTFVQQMANVGSEVGRSFKWQKNGRDERAEACFFRALELIDLTLLYGRAGESHERRYSMLAELCRLREDYCRAFLEHDETSYSFYDKYFTAFGIAANRNK